MLEKSKNILSVQKNLCRRELRLKYRIEDPRGHGVSGSALSSLKQVRGSTPACVYGDTLLGSILSLCGPTRCERGLVWASVQDTAWFLPKKKKETTLWIQRKGRKFGFSVTVYHLLVLSQRSVWDSVILQHLFINFWIILILIFQNFPVGSAPIKKE